MAARTPAPPFPYLTPFFGKIYDGNGKSTELMDKKVLKWFNDLAQAAYSAVPTLITGVANVMDYGAVGDGISSDVFAIQRAADTGLSVYFPKPPIRYVVDDAITLPTTGQILFGAGRTVSEILIPSTSNLAATGYFMATGGEPGPQFRDLGFICQQPDTAVRANLVAYPPVLYMRSAPRFVVERCRINTAMVGIDAAGGTNVGGALIRDLEISAFTVSIDIDGSLDSWVIDALRIESFGCTVNSIGIFTDMTTIGLRSGHCDDLKLSNSLFACGPNQMKLITTASGSTFGEITNTDFDNWGGLVMESGKLSIMGGFFSLGVAAGQSIRQSGGQLRIAGVNLEAAVALNNPMIAISGGDSAEFSADTCIATINGDNSVLEVKASAGINQARIVNFKVIAPANSSPAAPLFSQLAGGQLSVIGAGPSAKGTGTGSFITVAVDGPHLIDDVVPNGWTIDLPAGAVSLIAPLGPKLSYAPVPTASSGAFTTIAAAGTYILRGSMVDLEVTITITLNGSAAGYIIVPLPISAAIATALSGEKAGIGLTVPVPAGANARVYLYDGTYPGGSATVLKIAGSYRIH